MVCAPKSNSTPLSGWPSKRSRKTSDHPTVKPQLAGRNEEIAISFAASNSTHVPSEPKPRPASAAKREHRRTRSDYPFAIRCLKPQSPLLVPASPAMPKRELYALRIQPPQPGAQQGRSLEALRKHPPAGADEGRLAQRVAPFAQPIRRKVGDHGFQPRRRFAIACKERGQRLAVGQIEPAAPGHQEFAAGRRHRVVDGDANAALRQHFRRHQPGWAGADDDDVHR